MVAARQEADVVEPGLLPLLGAVDGRRPHLVTALAGDEHRKSRAYPLLTRRP